MALLAERVDLNRWVVGSNIKAIAWIHWIWQEITYKKITRHLLTTYRLIWMPIEVKCNVFSLYMNKVFYDTSKYIYIYIYIYIERERERVEAVEVYWIPAKRVQILDETVCLSRSTNTPGKSINSTSLLPDTDK